MERLWPRRRIKMKIIVPEIARRPIRPEIIPPIMAGDSDGVSSVGVMEEVGAAVFD